MIAPIDSIMLWAMLGSGVVASIVSRHELLLITPLITALIFLASKQAHDRLEEMPALAELPARAAAAVDRAMTRLPAGDARRMLGDVVREAGRVFAMQSSAFDSSKDNEARAEAEELLVASCDTALELAQLDDMLEVHTGPDSGDTPVDMSLLNKLSSGRDLFATRLRDAGMALAALYASGVVQGTPASDRVAELVTELKSDAGSRVAAKRELDDLLGPPTQS